MAILHEIKLNHPAHRWVTATHGDRTYRFTVDENDQVIAARIKVHTPYRANSYYWRPVTLSKATVAAANGNGLIVRE
jgi:adenosyl cobinamide kinase/adenosyl cobinamide phosphate guanylyltransferase